jgi:hypothetical protein
MYHRGKRRCGKKKKKNLVLHLGLVGLAPWSVPWPAPSSSMPSKSKAKEPKSQRAKGKGATCFQASTSTSTRPRFHFYILSPPRPPPPPPPQILPVFGFHLVPRPMRCLSNTPRRSSCRWRLCALATAQVDQAKIPPKNVTYN